jgi:hypothetical protein
VVEGFLPPSRSSHKAGRSDPIEMTFLRYDFYFPSPADYSSSRTFVFLTESLYSTDSHASGQIVIFVSSLLAR